MHCVCSNRCKFTLESKSCFNVHYKSLANLVVMLSLVVQVYICKPSCCKWNLFYLFGNNCILVYIDIPALSDLPYSVV